MDGWMTLSDFHGQLDQAQDQHRPSMSGSSAFFTLQLLVLKTPLSLSQRWN
jgi:hypothetical protein